MASLGESQLEWEVFCGRGNNFSVWVDGDFGHCFEQLVFSCTTHILFAAASIYHTWSQSHRRIAGPLPRSPTLHTRLAISIAIALVPLFLISLTYLLLESNMSLVDIITACVKIITWLMHSGFVFRHHRMYHVHIRGPVAVIISFFLTAISTGIQLRTVIFHVINYSHFLNDVDKYTTYVTTGFYVLYILSLIPYRRPPLTHHNYSFSIQDADSIGSVSSPESEPLLGAGRPQSYGGIPRSISEDGQALGIAEDYNNCLSKFTFFWVRSLMVKGAMNSLRRSRDLYDLPHKLRTLYIEDKFKATLEPQSGNELIRGRSLEASGSTDSVGSSIGPIPDIQYSKPLTTATCARSLLSALNSCFGVEYYSLGIIKLLSDLLAFAGPILLNYLVSYMENSKEPTYHGYLYAAGLFGSTLVGAFLSSHFSYRITNCGLKIRAAVITTVYRKTMCASPVAIAKFSTGEVVNFMSTDTDRIVNFCPTFHQFWSLPFQVVLSLYLLYQQVGLAFLAGLAFGIILVPINRWIANKIGQLSTEMMCHKDSRVKIMSEILSGMRIIKFYAWEDYFADKVNAVRLKELKSLKGRKYLDALCVYFWATTPVLISILTFTTYVLMGNKLTAAKVFTSMALFNILMGPLNAFPWVINGLMEAWVSVKRVHSFITIPNLDLNRYYTTSAVLKRNTSIKISNGCFSWEFPQSDESGECLPSEERESGDGEEQTQCIEDHPTTDVNQRLETEPGMEETVGQQGMQREIPRSLQLRDINIEIKQGSLVGVIGKVGSGKSSLLSALLAHMYKDSGQVAISNLSAGFGLVSQEAWIQHATVKANILFGRPFSEEKYRSVLEACALEADLKVLPAGDETEIGENGVTLSGGQKARISLARAVYQDKDIYLLDDPLAAVDSHVANHLFSHCITGLLEGKTRLLATHHVKFLREADIILVMEDGRIVESGLPSEILGIEDVATETEEEKATSEDTKEEAVMKKVELSEPSVGQTLVEEEEQDSGVVKGHVYSTYWAAVGACLAPTVLIFIFLMQASRNISDWWLSYWVSHSHGDVTPSNCTLPNTTNSQSYDFLLNIPDQTLRGILFSSQHFDFTSSMKWCNTTEAEDNVQFYLMVYGILAASNSLFTFARAFLYAYGGIRAATVIHWYLLKSILKAPIGFFETTPIGRIVNRFSSDLYSVDDSLPFILNILLAQIFSIFGILVITCYGLPWFAILLLPLAVVYYFIQKYYRQTSREIKRISSVTLSPIYAHFSESLSGLNTIHALRHVDRFQVENRRRLEDNQKARFAANAACQWLGLRLQLIGVAMVTGVAFIAVLEHHFHTVNPGLVGLAISYALSITSLLSGVVNYFAETEKQMVSVERAAQYIEGIPGEQEDALLCMPPFWPIQGAITFHRVCLRYRKGLPLALNNVSFETQPAEKIGIVGRTGSGKSSLLVALFRMVELQDGYISIDGLNLSHLELRDLRSRMAVIPQDPFMFSGTVRENLDPRDLYTDTQLWTVLQRCHLTQVVERIGGLDAEVEEKGRLFSVGQRQLVCLARAMITRAKVLCIDEATASVDQETDAVIQETLRREFAHHTVLTIAHRIETILDNDRVLVMDDGRVAEFDPPGVLLENPESIFYGMVHALS